MIWYSIVFHDTIFCHLLWYCKIVFWYDPVLYNIWSYDDKIKYNMVSYDVISYIVLYNIVLFDLNQCCILWHYMIQLQMIQHIWYNILWFDVFPCYIKLYHIISNNTLSLHAMQNRIIWYNINNMIQYHIIWYKFMLYDTISYHLLQYCILSHDSIRYHVT